MITIFWFRRDLRLYDNAGLYEALKNSVSVLPLFIFDSDILSKLDSKDKRLPFIHNTICELKSTLNKKKSDLYIEYGQPENVFQLLIAKYKIKSVYANHDYEPIGIERDQRVKKILNAQGIEFLTYKDHVIFEKNEIRTDQDKPYTVYTAYKKKWLKTLTPSDLKPYPVEQFENNYYRLKLSEFAPTLEQMNFQPTAVVYPERNVSVKILKNYSTDRDYPAMNQTSKLGLHLRFGTVSPRELARQGQKYSEVWLSEIIWRDFFAQILFHYPHVVRCSFRKEYEKINWLNNKSDFERWQNGETGYPLVDAGMRELNETGHMHNRVRMVVASFLTKHLLTHWYLGERYFAAQLLDYDLSANNGNWQWAAGTGCDAAPYFRVFNPQIQMDKFDKDLVYTKTWVPELGSSRYVKEIVPHAFARVRAIHEYKKGLNK